MVAVIRALPLVTAVTSPDPETVATLWLFVVQFADRPEIVAPEASRAVANSCLVCAGDNVTDVGETATLATTGGATTLSLPPPPHAVTIAIAEK